MTALNCIESGAIAEVSAEMGELSVKAVFDVADCSAIVVSNQPVNSEYFHIVLKASGVALNADAGQFFNIACPPVGSDDPYLRRPMSVYRVDAPAGHVEFLYKVAGAGTRGLASVRQGDAVAILGPLGKGFTLDAKWKKIAVVGRGVGLATLAPLAELAATQRIHVSAILSARSKDLIMSQERFVNIGAHIDIVTDADDSSHLHNVERLLLRLIESRGVDAFFTCGSNRLMLLLKELAERFGIPGQVAMEQQMACGLGMCFCCVRSFATEKGQEQRRVCLEGPVFNLSEALSW